MRGCSPGRCREAVGHAGPERFQAHKRSLVTGSRPVRLGCVRTKPFWPHVMDSLPGRLGNGWSVMYSLSPVKALRRAPLGTPLEGRASGGSLVRPHRGSVFRLLTMLHTHRTAHCHAHESTRLVSPTSSQTTMLGPEGRRERMPASGLRTVTTWSLNVL